MDDGNQGLASLDGSKVVITGANGMLGRAFAQVLATCAPKAEVLALGRDALDVTQRDEVFALAGERPDIVLHCAVKADVNWCEDHAEEAAQVQVEGTAHVAALAKACGARLFFPQSFLIYEGGALVDEGTDPNPLSAYGRLKFEAEKTLLSILPDALVVRMGGFFGEQEADKNFVGKLIPHLASLLRSGVDRMEIGDRIWQPTYTRDLAYNSLLLLARRCTGAYCMASHGQASFFELGKEITRLLGIDQRLEIARVPAQTMAGKEKAVRPEVLVMRNSRLQAEGLDRQRPWQAALAEYLGQGHFNALFA